jgi:hypothetical protein
VKNFCGEKIKKIVKNKKIFGRKKIKKYLQKLKKIVKIFAGKNYEYGVRSN